MTTGKGTAKYRVYASYGKGNHVKFGFAEKKDALHMAKTARKHKDLKWVSVKKVNRK